MSDRSPISHDHLVEPTNSERREQVGATLVIHFVGSPDQAGVQDDLIDYLNKSGHVTLGISIEAMQAITETWDDASGVTFVNISNEKAQRLIDNIKKIFSGRANCFKMNIINNDLETREEAIDIKKAPLEIQKWYNDFEQEIKTGDMNGIANNLCMMGVEDPNHCDCTGEFANDEVSGWLHDNHRVYNTLIWRLLNGSNILEPLYKIFLEDDEKKLDDRTKIATSPYGRVLAKSFLSNSPDSTWVVK
ncbi:MAG: hypothetical protein WCV83_01875 [Candidatus Magasanikbacteria bacterium]|jgi:hypothetical protein